MARKKLERKIKQIIIHAGNIKEEIEFGSDEKISISKEEKEKKIKRIKNEIKKIHYRFPAKPKIKAKEISILNTKSVFNSMPLIELNPNIVINRNKDIYQKRDFKEENLDKSETTSKVLFEKLNEEQEDLFDDFLFDFI